MSRGDLNAPRSWKIRPRYVVRSPYAPLGCRLAECHLAGPTDSEACDEKQERTHKEDVNSDEEDTTP